MSNLLKSNLSVTELEKDVDKMGTAGTAPKGQEEAREKRKKCESLTGEARTNCIASTPTYSGKRRRTRKTRRRSTRRGARASRARPTR